MTKLIKNPNYIFMFYNYTQDISDWSERATIEEVMKLKQEYEAMYPHDNVEIKILAAGAIEIEG